MNRLCLAVGLLPLLFVTAQARETTPEQACLMNLQEEMKTDAVFANLDFSSVRKINGPEGETLESGEFSIATYDDFVKAFEVPVPMLQDDIQFYPHQLFNVSPVYTYELTPAKSNRNLSGILTYQDDVETSIGDVDDDGEEEIINGYYTDTRYVTFGRQNAFEYPPRSRDPNPASNRDFPGGNPYRDMREFIVFVQHLSEDFGGDLLSCGVFTFTPGEQYVLKSFSEDETEVSRDLFWRTDVQASDAKYKTIEDKNDHKFLRSTLRDTFLSRERNEDGTRPVLLVYNQILLSYDSGNSFLNDFEIAQYTRNFMTDPANLNKSFTNMRQELYEQLSDETDFGIIGGSGDGLALYDGVPLDLIQKVESIEDESVQNMIRAALVPNYGRYYGGFENLDLEDESNAFYRRYMEYPIDYQKRLENVEHIVDQADDLANLDVSTLEYKDMEFGGAVIPIMDARLRKISQTSYVNDEIQALIDERDALIAEIQAQIDAEEDALIIQELYSKITDIEKEFAAKISTVQAFEQQFKTFKMDFADIENKKLHGRITEEEYDSARRILFDEFQDYISAKGINTVLPESALESLSDDLVNTLKDKGEEEVVTKNEEPEMPEVVEPQKNRDPLWFKLVGVFLFMVGVSLVWSAIKLYRK